MTRPGDDAVVRPHDPDPDDAGAPSIARLYDFALGGKDNFAADRALFDQISTFYPEYRDFAVANRHFLVHAVRTMAQAGVRQFLDLGSGLPTSPNVHEVAGEVEPAPTVVYVDRDPVVVAHCAARLGPVPGVHAVQHDVRDAAGVLGDPDVASVIDLDQPVGLLAIAVLHFVEHDEALRMLAAYRAALAPGSRLAVSANAGHPDRHRDDLRPAAQSVSDSLRTPIIARSPEQVLELFDGFVLDDPGVVDVSAWRPGGEAGRPVWCASGLAHRD